MLTHNLEKSICKMSQDTGLKYSWLITGGPKSQPGRDSSRGAEATVAGCRTVGVSWVQSVCGVQQELCRGWEKGSACWEDGAFPWPASVPQRLLLTNCVKGRAFNVVGGDSQFYLTKNRRHVRKCGLLVQVLMVLLSCSSSAWYYWEVVVGHLREWA